MIITSLKDLALQNVHQWHLKEWLDGDLWVFVGRL